MIPLKEMLKNFLIICVVITWRNVHIDVHFFFAVKQIFCSWREDEYPYVGQKCSAESAGVLRGKSQCSLTVLKGCKMLYD